VIAIGHVYIKLLIHGKKGERELEGILVDSGASYTVLPLKLVKEVGAIKTPYTLDLELGDGRKVKAKAQVYVGSIEIEGREGPAIIASFKGAKSVIGVQSLEALGLKINPSTGKLEPTRPKGLAYFYFVCRACVSSLCPNE